MGQRYPSLIGTFISHPLFLRPAAAGCILGMLVLTACSGTPSALTPSIEISSLPSGGGSAPPTESTTLEKTSTPGNTVEAQGVYPPPESATEGNTPAPKAVTIPGSNSIFLPAIINEKSPDYSFVLQQTGVMAIQGFYGCNWTGVAGQVFDLGGIPIQNLILHLEGFWAGKVVLIEVLSGSASQYGPAGYEFVLGTQPTDSTQTLWIQLYDATHKELSARIYLDTYNDCAKNLILVNFNQVR
jgi:hypothetical protein